MTTFGKRHCGKIQNHWGNCFNFEKISYYIKALSELLNNLKLDFIYQNSVSTQISQNTAVFLCYICGNYPSEGEIERGLRREGGKEGKREMEMETERERESERERRKEEERKNWNHFP